MADRYERAWNVLRVRLVERFQMAREVLEEQGLGDVAALVPIEEVLVWMDEADEAMPPKEPHWLTFKDESNPSGA